MNCTPIIPINCNHEPDLKKPNESKSYLSQLDELVHNTERFVDQYVDFKENKDWETIQRSKDLIQLLESHSDYVNIFSKERIRLMIEYELSNLSVSIERIESANIELITISHLVTWESHTYKISYEIK